jgi:predicted phage replisome organizer
MDNVQWIKLKVGMFDGESFKKIKKAKIGGESFRDKLTAVWFELMDFAGKCNHSGFLINSREIPFQSISDIAVMIDRTPEELELCMNFFINEGMVEIIDDMYLLSNWMVYQNEAGLEKIREQTRLRVEKHRKKKALTEGKGEKECNATGNVTTALQNRYPLILNSNSSSNSSNKKKEEKGGTGEKGGKAQPVSDEISAAMSKLPSMVQDQMQDWLEYKTERKEFYTPRGLQSLMTVVKKRVDQYGAQAVNDVIERTMASNYRGVVWEWLERKPQPTKQSLRDNAPLDYGSPEDFYK